MTYPLLSVAQVILAQLQVSLVFLHFHTLNSSLKAINACKYKQNSSVLVSGGQRMYIKLKFHITRDAQIVKLTATKLLTALLFERLGVI